MQTLILEVEGDDARTPPRVTELLAILTEIGGALTTRLSKLDMRVIFKSVKLAVKFMKFDDFKFTWMVHTVDGTNNKFVLTYGFNVPVEALPIVGKKIASDLLKIPSLLKKDYPWLKITKNGIEI